MRKVSIGDIGDVVTGKTPRTEIKDNFGNDFLFITPNDLANGFPIRVTERCLSNKGLEEVSNNSIDGISVVVDCIGSDLGNVALVDTKCVTNQQINAVTNFKEQVNPYYVYFWFKNKKAYLQKIAGGTSVPIVNKTLFSNIKIKLPEKTIQDEIANKLLSFENKISLNNQLIDYLEEYAQLLFHKWFVDFNFPDEEGKPYKDNGGEMYEVDGKMIPVGWTREKIGKWKKAELIKSGILEFEGEKRYITTSDVVGIDINLGADKVNYGDRTSRANMQPELNSVWFAKMQNSPKHIFITEENFVESYILSTGFAGLRCDEISFPYIATFVNSRQFEEMKNLRCNGSTQKAINDEGIKTIKVVIPNEEVLSSFSKITYPIYKKINLLQQENQLLEETRDLLIRKLIK